MEIKPSFPNSKVNCISTADGNLEFRSSKITEPFNDVKNIRRFELGTIGFSSKKRLFSLTFE